MERAGHIIGVAAEGLWLNALVAVPVALLAAAVCRWRACRPATRHGLWMVVLASFVLPAAAGRLVPDPGFDAAGAGRAVANAAGRAERFAAGLIERARRSWAPPPATTAHNADPHPASPGAPGATKKSDPTPAAPQGAPPLPTLAALDGVSRWPVPGLETILRLRPFAPGSGAGGDPARVDASPVAGTTTPAPPPGRAGEPREAAPSAPPRAAPIPPRPTGQRETPTPPVARSAPNLAGPAPAAPPLPARVAAAPASGPAPPGLADQVADWMSHAGALRRAVAELPPIPVPIWLGGLGVVLAWRAAQYVAARHALRGSAPAPEPVVRLTEECAALVGLRRAPRVSMVERRVSPMVWCAGRTRLILPADLWRTLDARSRRAVLVHELAHLRRRDHWVWRASLLVGAVFWWHPVAWWAARRVREEADLSCDAWVTALLPASRRAYAEALLAAQSFVAGPRLLPLPALCMASTRTRRLSRRLIMVMTNVKAPRSSPAGLLLAAAIAAGALLISPSLACPPEEKEGKKTTLKTTVTTTARPALAVLSTPRPPKPPHQPAPPAPPEAPAPPHEGHAAAAHHALVQALAAHQPGDDDAAMRRLIERLERLEARLSELDSRLAGQAGQAPRAGAHGAGGAASGPTRAPRAVVEVRPETTVRVVPPAPAHARNLAPTPAPQADGPTETRTYHLPQGKMEAMWELMAREDVPVFVSREGEEGISVQGTPAQHRVFRAFVEMIHPEGKPRSDAERELPERGDAARADRRHDDQHRAEQHRAELTRAMEQTRAHLAELHARHRAAQAQADMLRRQAEELNRQAERLREQADRLRNKAEEMREKADDADDEGSRDGLHTAADATEAQADEVEAQADALEAQAEAVEADGDAVEEQAEELAEQAEELAEEAEEAAREARDQARVGATAPAAPTGVFAPAR